MRRYLQYTMYVLRHKWYVFLACLDLRVGLMAGLLHDLSKFRYSEFVAYAKHFYNSDGSRCCVPRKRASEDFEYAWLHHQNNNKHHWQAWVIITDGGILKPLEMPNRYVFEMIADWIGAGKAISGNPDSNPMRWYAQNKSKMILHSKTKALVESILYSKYGVF